MTYSICKKNYFLCSFFLLAVFISGVAMGYAWLYYTYHSDSQKLYLPSPEVSEAWRDIGNVILAGEANLRSGQRTWVLGYLEVNDINEKMKGLELFAGNWYLNTDKHSSWEMFIAFSGGATSQVPIRILEEIKFNSLEVYFLHRNYNKKSYHVLVVPQREIFIGFWI